MKFGYDIFTFVYAFENLDSDFNTQYSTFSEIIIQSHLYSNLKEKTQNTSLLTRFTSYATPPPPEIGLHSLSPTVYHLKI